MRCYDCAEPATRSDSFLVWRSKAARHPTKAVMVQRSTRIRVHARCMLSTDWVVRTKAPPPT